MRQRGPPKKQGGCSSPSPTYRVPVSSNQTTGLPTYFAPDTHPARPCRHHLRSDAGSRAFLTHLVRSPPLGLTIRQRHFRICIRPGCPVERLQRRHGSEEYHSKGQDGVCGNGGFCVFFRPHVVRLTLLASSSRFWPSRRVPRKIHPAKLAGSRTNPPPSVRLRSSFHTDSSVDCYLSSHLQSGHHSTDPSGTIGAPAVVHRYFVAISGGSYR